MQIIYKITLTLWVAFVATLFADGFIFGVGANSPEWFMAAGGYLLIAAICFSLSSAICLIWS